MLSPMKLVGDPDVAAWLGGRPTMDWDAGNSTKSQAKHGITTSDVDSMLDARPLFAGRIDEPAHEEARYLLLGVTPTGDRAALIFARRDDKLRPISCRARRKREKEATMKRQSKTSIARSMKNAATGRDATLRDLEKRDLGDDIKSAGTTVVVRPQRATSILLGDDLKEALRRRGKQLGVGHQTAAKMILAKYANAKL